MRTAIVTGAARGIGEALALDLARWGWRVEGFGLAAGPGAEGVEFGAGLNIGLAQALVRPGHHRGEHAVFAGCGVTGDRLDLCIVVPRLGDGLANLLNLHRIPNQSRPCEASRTRVAHHAAHFGLNLREHSVRAEPFEQTAIDLTGLDLLRERLRTRRGVRSHAHHHAKRIFGGVSLECLGDDLSI